MTAGRLRLAGIALSLIGIGVAGYLTWVHFADTEAVCVGGGQSCERVQSSEYAELGGIPVAVIGLGGYVVLLVSFLLRGSRAALAAAFLALGGFAFSAYLTYLELFVIEAICQWCVASAIVMTALAAVAVARYLQVEP